MKRSIFIAIRHAPSTELFVGKLPMRDNGYLITQPYSARTSIPGVYTAGDVTNETYRQAVTAAGMDAWPRWKPNAGCPKKQRMLRRLRRSRLSGLNCQPISNLTTMLAIEAVQRITSGARNRAASIGWLDSASFSSTSSN